jgi:hypothetical protein
VATSSMLLRGLDMSLQDMRQEAVSEQTAGSDGSEPLTVVGGNPLGLLGTLGTKPTAYVAPPSGESDLSPTESSLFARDK